MNKQTARMTLLLLGICLSSCSKFPPRKYYYVDKSVTWYEAQQYCREHYTDLATFESMSDINMLLTPFTHNGAWIGLWDDPNSWKYGISSNSNSWRWSTIGETTQTNYVIWDTTNPDFQSSSETCGGIWYGKWYDADCNKTRNFACYSVTQQNVKKYVFIQTSKTWSSAQAYCRTHYTDLAKVDNHAENSELTKTIPDGYDTWIGLYRVPWSWSDKSRSLFKNWDSSSPNNANGNQHCVAENTLHQWNDENCNVNKVFICHQVVKITTTVRLTTVTDVELTDPAINAQVLQQLGALLTSQGWTDFKMQWKTPPKKKGNNE
ncbi:hypothetical protein GOODEAATRI_026518 [Goodea atripinnis]|uniref:C-type lectin domain-containing protein n=1 Tax=Goodea atripinnis TaxID=208336 RepID=A0ABV0NND3_9TELE